MRYRVVVAALVVSLCCAFASAANVDLNYITYKGGEIKNNVDTGNAGVFKFAVTNDYDDTDVPAYLREPDTGTNYFPAFCIEALATQKNGQHAIRAAGDAPIANGDYGPMGTNGQIALERLFAAYTFDDFDTYDEWAAKGNAYNMAFQLAIWEIVYENSIHSYNVANSIDDSSTYTGSYNVSVNDGLFWSTSGDSTLIAAANAWLAYANNANGARANIAALVYKNGTESGQDFVVRLDGSTTTDNPVPLPPAVLMGFGLLGALGLARRIRRRK